MRARRTFDEKFKRQVIESVLSGSVSQVELSRKYTISPLLISRWKKEYTTSLLVTEILTQILPTGLMK